MVSEKQFKLIWCKLLKIVELLGDDIENSAFWWLMKKGGLKECAEKGRFTVPQEYRFPKPLMSEKEYNLSKNCDKLEDPKKFGYVAHLRNIGFILYRKDSFLVFKPSAECNLDHLKKASKQIANDPLERIENYNKPSKLDDISDDEDLEDLILQFKDYQFACNAMEEELIQKIEQLKISIQKKNENKQISKERLKRILKEKDGEWKEKLEREIKRKLKDRDEEWKKLKEELKRKDEQLKLINEEWRNKEKQLKFDIEQEKIIFSKKLEMAFENFNSNSVMKRLGSTKETLQESIQFNIFDPAHLGFRKDCGKIFISSFQERAGILHSYQISAILDLSSSKNKSQEIVVEAKYLSIEMYDSPNNSNPNTIFEKGCNFILEAIQNKKNILIYCDLGLSRSPTMVMAFICSHMENFNEFDAQKLLQEKCNHSYSLRATLQTTLQNFCNHLKKRSKSNK